ncbi:Ubiquitin-like modifier-activating enzyme atg7 [Bienertia sinuspersici]
MGSMMMIIPFWITQFGILLQLGFNNRLKRGDDLRSYKNCSLCRTPIVNEVLGGDFVIRNLNSSFGEKS